MLFQHFWRHVIWSSKHSLHLIIRTLSLRQSKVDQLQLSSGVQHDVFRLDISMHNPLRMHVMASSQQLLHVNSGLIFVKYLVLLSRNLINELTASNILHDEVNELFINIRLVVLNDIRVIQFSEDINF